MIKEKYINSPFSITEGQKLALRKKADKRGLSVSAYIRQVLIENKIIPAN